MRKLTWIFLLNLMLVACVEGREEEALTKQNDIAIAHGYCTDLTVTALNKVQLAPPEEAFDACQDLQILLKGRTCENNEQIFPEDEQISKCELALNKEVSTPEPLPEAPTQQPIIVSPPAEMVVCSENILDAFKELKKTKVAMDKRKTTSGTRKAVKQCEMVDALMDRNACKAKDTKTGQVKELTLKSAGLYLFCKNLKNSQK